MNLDEANAISIHIGEIRLVLTVLVGAIVAMAGGFIYLFHYISKMTKGFNETIMNQSNTLITVTKDNTHAMDKLVSSVEQNTRTLENLPNQFMLIANRK